MDWNGAASLLQPPLPNWVSAPLGMWSNIFYLVGFSEQLTMVISAGILSVSTRLSLPIRPCISTMNSMRYLGLDRLGSMKLPQKYPHRFSHSRSLVVIRGIVSVAGCGGEGESQQRLRSAEILHTREQLSCALSSRPSIIIDQRRDGGAQVAIYSCHGHNTANAADARTIWPPSIVVLERLFCLRDHPGCHRPPVVVDRTWPKRCQTKLSAWMDAYSTLGLLVKKPGLVLAYTVAMIRFQVDFLFSNLPPCAAFLSKSGW